VTKSVGNIRTCDTGDDEIRAFHVWVCIVTIAERDEGENDEMEVSREEEAVGLHWYFVKRLFPIREAEDQSVLWSFETELELWTQTLVATGPVSIRCLCAGIVRRVYRSS
jgi:hypothetical protein